MHLEVLTEQTLYGHLLRHRADQIHLHFVQQANHQAYICGEDGALFFKAAEQSGFTDSALERSQ